MAKKQKKEAGGSGGEWIVTYSDMVTLMLCFFVALFNPDDTDPSQMAAMISSFANLGMGANSGGNTLSPGKLAELGNTIMSLPSMEKGRAMGTAYKKAVSLFAPEIKTNRVQVMHEERGLIITLASDAFFNPASARINIEQTRDILLRLGSLLRLGVGFGHRNVPVRKGPEGVVVDGLEGGPHHKEGQKKGDAQQHLVGRYLLKGQRLFDKVKNDGNPEETGHQNDDARRQ
ncbi:hypothetical protein AGMMS50267_07110 [Spirochaetia bacterium]|nr:hypothetical protein AGMMS50267_07110 [Spirochaetia bacterium]